MNTFINISMGLIVGLTVLALFGMLNTLSGMMNLS